MIPASHPIPAPVKREPLTKWQFATLFLKQAGLCAVCRCDLKPGQTRDEHIVSLDGGGTNDLTNRALWCLPCTKPKDAQDKARSAKAKRIRGETGAGRKRPIQSRGFQPGAGAKLQSRGFPSKFERERLKAIREKTPIEREADANA